MNQLLGPLLLFLVFIVFFIVIPRQKQMKQQKTFFNNLKKGDKIVTSGGIHGRVSEILDDGTCIIETGAGKIKIEKMNLSIEKSTKLNAPVK
ncbi:MAG: preprotein translocase subunit YajC [Flavobacteriaceae bacterium]|nr:preprotein translocase subunit YajC [Flavobacteriaceae bacterium]